MENIYKIEGSIFKNPPSEYSDKTVFPDFQNQLEIFKNTLKKQVKDGNGVTYYKFGDGDYFFLKKEGVGSAKPGNRALSKKYWRINHKEFKKGSKKNHFYLCEIINSNKNYFNEIFKKNFDYPAEFVYGLTSNRWLTNTFSGKIGIIGAKEKIELIRNLLEHEIYKEYLGLDQFLDYIEIPQKFACDDINNLRKKVSAQLKNSKSEVFLYGIGHVKSGLSYLFPEYKKAVYLDIGSGVDALAGIIDKQRPYFGNWTNYKLNDDSFYKNIDYLNFNFDGSETILN